MNAEYKIAPQGNQFELLDDENHPLGIFGSVRQAETEVARRKRDDRRFETARLLVQTAVESLMKVHKISELTARYWIREASG
jgi:hypothetical protein